MRLLLGMIAVAIAAGVIYALIMGTHRALGSRRDNKRLKNERIAAITGLNNVRDIVVPYLSMGGDAALLADMVYSEIRKTDDNLRKELQ